jgi:cyclophilin family peptidyl-prolyl cis-trans isomerase
MMKTLKGFATLAASCLLFLGLAMPVQAAEPTVVIATNMGNITVELNPALAPKSVANFLKYVEDKHYDGTVFHRVIKDFMIQGGGYTENLSQKPTKAPVVNEAKNGLKNVRGSIAMARTGDPDSATSQFFINTVNNSSLDYPKPDGYGYAVFGKVIAGMDVVDKIRAVQTGNVGPFSDVPTKPVIINSIRLAPAAAK